MTRHPIHRACIPLFLVISLAACVKPLTSEVTSTYGDQPPPGINPEEMHQWTPPSEAELEQRRQNQVVLDQLASEIEQLLLSYDKVDQEVRNLGVGVASWNPRMEALDKKLAGEILALQEREESWKQQTATLRRQIEAAEKELEELRRLQEARKFRPRRYRDAFLRFRDRQYAEAAKRFLQLLQTRYPAHLRDNLLFGLGAAYFKLGQWERSAKYLDTLIRQEPGGDKWFEANLLLGLVYNRSGRKSQALYVLEKALKENPPASIRRLMERLVAVSEKGQDIDGS